MCPKRISRRLRTESRRSPGARDKGARCLPTALAPRIMKIRTTASRSFSKRRLRASIVGEPGKTGTSLSLEGVASILQDRECPAVALLGMPKSGKTTFVAMLYHQFLSHYKGFSGHRFMGSETFLSLNEKPHDDKRSDQIEADIPRSSLEEELRLSLQIDGIGRPSLRVDLDRYSWRRVEAVAV